eukprot:CAMPEP_0114633386 /NCGR_PEP_ID=MMETSP0168-20121206/15427_1 /TAXON_ID=95228 ORGANISM="Vannella sp., Strain DIVA3 517/6/12" /NCGR_SAMPLE_ID=MMETSP0168 /ASSEMBLY_ACC=CAM_ASM_000044 /LENGTH=57 /DNA_ID=CAMNT_0001845033 /DNA_START=104 /DNA_END=277 /DNA_ORIENTATION=+
MPLYRAPWNYAIAFVVGYSAGSFAERSMARDQEALNRLLCTMNRRRAHIQQLEAESA